jgi:hypothetical protein
MKTRLGNGDAEAGETATRHRPPTEFGDGDADRWQTTPQRQKSVVTDGLATVSGGKMDKDGIDSCSERDLERGLAKRDMWNGRWRAANTMRNASVSGVTGLAALAAATEYEGVHGSPRHDPLPFARQAISSGSRRVYTAASGIGFNR